MPRVIKFTPPRHRTKPDPASSDEAYQQFRLTRVLAALGDGDVERGKRLLYDLTLRLEYARGKHIWHGRTEHYAVRAVEGETEELRRAVVCDEGPRRVYDEALDGAVVNLRTAGREWE